MPKIPAGYYAFLSLIVLVGCFGLAFLLLLLQSFGYAPLYSINHFPTLVYYQSILQDTHLIPALGYSLLYALVPTIVGIILSTMFALALRKDMMPWARIFYPLPLFLPYMVGVALVIMLFSNGGLVARIAYALNLIESTRDFPRLLNTSSGWGVMLVYLWKQIPFSTLLITNALFANDQNLEGVARSLGANAWQSFWYVTLPRLVPAIVAATTIVFAFNLVNFEVPFILSNSDTLSVLAYRAFQDADYSHRLEGAALLCLLTALSMTLLLLYSRLLKRW